MASDLTPPDLLHPWERYTHADPKLSETVYESIKSLKDRIARDSLDLKIDSHKGFLRCEEPDCPFALKIRYGSSRGHVILGKSRFEHNHDTTGLKPKTIRRQKLEIMEKYYNPIMVRDIKLKDVLADIEKQIGEPLTPEELKKFKNKIYNIRQKLRREGEILSTASSTRASTPVAVKTKHLPGPGAASAATGSATTSTTTSTTDEQQQQNDEENGDRYGFGKRKPLVNKISADAIKNIIYESQQQQQAQQQAQQQQQQQQQQQKKHLPQAPTQGQQQGESNNIFATTTTHHKDNNITSTTATTDSETAAAHTLAQAAAQAAAEAQAQAQSQSQQKQTAASASASASGTSAKPEPTPEPEQEFKENPIKLPMPKKRYLPPPSMEDSAEQQPDSKKKKTSSSNSTSTSTSTGTGGLIPNPFRRFI